jgi:hypothetical protein
MSTREAEARLTPKKNWPGGRNFLAPSTFLTKFAYRTELAARISGQKFENEPGKGGNFRRWPPSILKRTRHHVVLDHFQQQRPNAMLQLDEDMTDFDRHMTGEGAVVGTLWRKPH